MIDEDNLSYAWGKAFLLMMQRSKRDLAPLTISISGFQKSIPVEDGRIRQALDDKLSGLEKYSSAVSASAIFPYKPWVRRDYPPCSEFSTWYLANFLPRLKARDRRNKNGTYFERMIAFLGVKQNGGKPEIVAKNQLQHIIDDWKRERSHPKRPRQSALQLGCFDPAKDHTGQAVRGFPCLQQVSLAYDDNDGLAVNAYYPTQYIFDRAYGNYLGLSHLGHFIAYELGLSLVRVNCFIGHPELGDVTKAQLYGLETTVREILHSCTVQSSAAAERCFQTERSLNNGILE